MCTAVGVCRQPAVLVMSAKTDVNRSTEHMTEKSTTSRHVKPDAAAALATHGDATHGDDIGKPSLSANSATKQCLRSRTRSVDAVKVQHATQPSQPTQSTGDVGSARVRSKSVERRDDNRRDDKLRDVKRRVKLTVPHTPQQLK